MYPAIDRTTGDRVAFKLLRGWDEETVRRGERELRALELLRVPGVARLVDTGTLDGQRYLVTEWVDGAPFPGLLPDTTPAAVLPRLAALLEILADVHALGVVHRDLKPSNILVSTAGQPTLLDFGLARGRALGAPITEPLDVLGTTLFVAPEVLAGHMEPGVPADLYAVGVIAWLALGGGPPPSPFSAHDVPPRLASLRAWLAAMLAPSPADRPTTANAALRALTDPGRLRAIPFVGRTRELALALDHLDQGRPFRITGPPGAGRSRFVAEVARHIADTGRPVRWLPAADRPFGSLVDAGLPTPADDASYTTVQATLLDRLHILLRNETLLVDDEATLDTATARLLPHAHGPILLATSTTADTSLGPLLPADLEALFTGTERILHLRSGPAQALYDRTAGHAAAVAAELAAWERAKLAAWVDGRMQVSADGLGRIRSGVRVAHATVHTRPDAEVDREVLACISLAEPHATAEIVAGALGRPPWVVEHALDSLRHHHLVGQTLDGRLRDLSFGSTQAALDADQRLAIRGRLARLVPADAPERVHHALFAGLPDAAEVAAEVVRRLDARGEVSLAVSLASAAHTWLTAELPSADLGAIETAWAIVALDSQELDPLRVVTTALGRRTAVDPRLLRLLDAATAALDGKPAIALAALDGWSTDGELEGWRHTLRALAASRIDTPTFVAVAEGLAAHADTVGGGRAWAALGRARYLQGRLPDAIAHHERAAAAATTTGTRLAALTAIAACALDLGDWERAHGSATAALDLARTHAWCFYEARAEWLIRRAEYGAGTTTEPDRELIQAVDHLGTPYLEGLILLTEAAIAWRADLPDARVLAAAAADRLDGHLAPAAALSRALLGACGGPPASPVDTLPAGIALQVQALGGITPGDPADHLAACINEHPEHRRELLSLTECAARLGLPLPRSVGRDSRP